MLRTIGYILALIALLTLPVSCTVYKYKECKKVGHGTFYCVFMNNNGK